MVRDQTLRDDVVLVEAEPVGADVERADRLAGWEPLQVGHRDLHDEAPARRELGGDALEAGDLLVLGRQVHDGVEDEVSEGEARSGARAGEVADRDVDLVAARLRTQPCEHRFRQVDAVDPDTAVRQRQGYSAGADAELDLMARLAGLTLRERWAGWRREPFTADSRQHVSVWEKAAR